MSPELRPVREALAKPRSETGAITAATEGARRAKSSTQPGSGGANKAMFAILTLYIVVAIVAAIVAGNKGRSGASWFLLCLLLTPLAILILLALPPLKPVEPQSVRVVEEKDSGQRIPCPYCAELILPAAQVCRFCSRELPQGWAGVAMAEKLRQFGPSLSVGSRVRRHVHGSVGEVIAIKGETVTVRWPDPLLGKR